MTNYRYVKACVYDEDGFERGRSGQLIKYGFLKRLLWCYYETLSIVMIRIIMWTMMLMIDDDEHVYNDDNELVYG